VDLSEGAYAEPVASTRSCSCWRAATTANQGAGARLGKPAGVSLFDQPVTIVARAGITSHCSNCCTISCPRHCRSSPTRTSRGRQTNGRSEHLNDALASARVVVLAPALTAQTYHMIGQGELDVMRDDAWLVNVGREDS